MWNTFGNRVKIKSTAETIEKGVAGRTGDVMGDSTLQFAEGGIIGQPQDDHVVSVFFKDTGEQYWFDEELLEFVDNGKGAVITIGSSGKFIKGDNGEWLEMKPEDDITKTAQSKKPWWKFWK